MSNSNTRTPLLVTWRSPLMSVLIALAGAASFTALVIILAGAPVGETYRQVLFGAFLGLFEEPARYTNLADALMLAAPLLLCAAGLSLTFAVGLYNLGIEGQMGMGAVFALLAYRLFPGLPLPLLLAFVFVFGAFGGALWAIIAGILKLYGRVSEIFTGLGLNFLATGVILYLVFGPWKRPGVASMAGTELLKKELWLPTVERLRLAPIAPVVAILALLVVWFVLARTRWGLSVRATGLNAIAAERLGIPANRRLIEALAACGALAGMAGAIQVAGVFHVLIPNVSSGIGLLGLLIALLVRANPVWLLPVAILFACFTAGSIQLPLTLEIDSSIAGVLQGAIVFFALLASGLTRRS
jgi:general nucleoside transport system permease protein